MTMHRLALAAAVAVLFAGCATQGTDDQAANAQPASRAAQAPAPAPAPQSSLRAGSGVRDAKTMPNASSVYYQYDQSSITAEGKKLVEAHAEYLRAHPGTKVVVEGNADERGSAEYNLALGQRRADSVSKIMTLLGVPAERIETVSLGKEKPRASGHGESAWSENRRSDIVYR